ncbi:hypothetical protein L917_14676 [Phytophthora nicotianae]|uniref:Uncharacterized protein n=1 Tax=Phytophthora nicotianae TaxID=4792 RepID=W2KKY1_PHYNI|nr:hypothetical protein L917_14676 [Phytophthora nicotianae]
MERFLKEQRAAQGTPSVPLVRRTEPQDVNMESVGSDHGEYVPLVVPGQSQVDSLSGLLAACAALCTVTEFVQPGKY